MPTDPNQLSAVLNTWVASSRNTAITEIFTADQDDVVFRAGSNEMLRISAQGFWVREQQIPAHDQEAATVYRAFREWLTWAHVNRP